MTYNALHPQNYQVIDSSSRQLQLMHAATCQPPGISLSAAPFPLLAIDSAFRIIAVNRAAKNLVGEIHTNAMVSELPFVFADGGRFLSRTMRQQKVEPIAINVQWRNGCFGRWLVSSWKEPAEVTVIAILDSKVLTLTQFESELNRAQLIEERTRSSHYYREARTDHLTQAGNLRAMSEATETLMDRRHGGGFELTIVFVDVDDFKALNKLLTWSGANRVLNAVVSGVQTGLRRDDRIYRFGGEEFVVVLQNTPLNRGIALAERFRLIVERSAGMRVKATISAGCAHCTSPDRFYDVLELSQKAAQWAKANGKNCVVAGWLDENGTPAFGFTTTEEQ